uniref:Uncharacterized protein n=1 Tax=Rhizophora mucronata TaxID=61149 RepID=A0A2P2PNM7_RHIMU
MMFLSSSAPLNPSSVFPSKSKIT